MFGKVHDPTFAGTTTFGFRTVIDMKVALAVALECSPCSSSSERSGSTRLGPPAPSWLGRAHRVSGAFTVMLVVFVAYHCLWALGLESGTQADGEPV